MFIEKFSKRATLNVLESFKIEYKYTVQVQLRVCSYVLHFIHVWKYNEIKG